MIYMSNKISVTRTVRGKRKNLVYENETYAMPDKVLFKLTKGLLREHRLRMRGPNGRIEGN